MGYKCFTNNIISSQVVVNVKIILLCGRHVNDTLDTNDDG